MYWIVWSMFFCRTCGVGVEEALVGREAAQGMPWSERPPLDLLEGGVASPVICAARISTPSNPIAAEVDALVDGDFRVVEECQKE